MPTTCSGLRLPTAEKFPMLAGKTVASGFSAFSRLSALYSLQSLSLICKCSGDGTVSVCHCLSCISDSEICLWTYANFSFTGEAGISALLVAVFCSTELWENVWSLKRFHFVTTRIIHMCHRSINKALTVTVPGYRQITIDTFSETNWEFVVVCIQL